MIRKTAGLALILGALASQPAKADDVDSAYALCRIMDGTGLLSKECEVSGYDGAVDVSLDMSSSEARELCAGIKPTIAQKGVTFGPRWKLRIYSPYSGDNTIAVCPLGS